MQLMVLSTLGAVASLASLDIRHSFSSPIEFDAYQLDTPLFPLPFFLFFSFLSFPLFQLYMNCGS